MDPKLFLSTFLMIFLAELGDKTQLSVVGRAAAPSAKWTVFVAASLALIFSTFVAVQFGSLLTRYVPERYIKLGAGVLFLIIGGLVLMEGLQPARAAVPAAAAQPVGALGRFVLAQAAAFERAAFEDYRALAAGAKSERVRVALTELAVEEEEHFRRIGELHAEHEAAVLPAAATLGLPGAAELQHDVARADQPVLEHALAHELATAGFYRQLAGVTPIPSLRNAFAALAEAEERHAERLRSLLASSEA